MYLELGIIILLVCISYLTGRQKGHREGYDKMRNEMEEMIDAGQLQDHRSGYQDFLEDTKED